MNERTTASEVVVSERKEEIVKEAKRIEEATLYSCKAHFVASNFWRRMHLILGIPATVLAAIAAAEAFSRTGSGNAIGAWISVGVAA